MQQNYIVVLISIHFALQSEFQKMYLLSAFLFPASRCAWHYEQAIFQFTQICTLYI